jgi:uncharacterized protein YeaO (DUF488 family)
MSLSDNLIAAYSLLKKATSLKDVLDELVGSINSGEFGKAEKLYDVIVDELAVRGVDHPEDNLKTWLAENVPNYDAFQAHCDSKENIDEFDEPIEQDYVAANFKSRLSKTADSGLANMLNGLPKQINTGDFENAADALDILVDEVTQRDIPKDELVDYIKGMCKSEKFDEFIKFWEMKELPEFDGGFDLGEEEPKVASKSLQNLLRVAEYIKFSLVKSADGTNLSQILHSIPVDINNGEVDKAVDNAFFLVQDIIGLEKKDALLEKVEERTDPDKFQQFVSALNDKFGEGEGGLDSLLDMPEQAVASNKTERLIRMANVLAQCSAR